MTDHVPPVVEEPRGSFFSNIVAIIGLIILIVVVIWGLAHLVGLSQGWLTSLFNRTPKVSITAPSQAVSGERFTMSWKYSTTDRGNYAFLYQCKNGLTLKNGDNTIPCGTAYTVGTATTMSFTPLLEGISTTSMPVTVVFLPNATSSQRVQGSATINISKPSGSGTNTPISPTPTPVTSPTPTPTPTPTVKPTPLPTPAPTTRPPSPSPTPTSPPVTTKSPANLTVRILAIGVIDRNTGMFVQRPPMYIDDIAAAQFDISNVGGSTSGTYYFSANLPTAGGYVYNSPAQNPLHAGDHMINTLRWTNSAQVGTFTVALSGDTIPGDNYASATISSYAQPGYQQPTYYQPQQYNNYYSSPNYYQTYTY